MPSHEHEALVRLFREDPSLVPTVLHQWLGLPVPVDPSCSVADSALTETQPAELRADAVFLLHDARGRTELAVVLEVQRDWDDRKHWTWPA
jgi:hypothetical protein